MEDSGACASKVPIVSFSEYSVISKTVDSLDLIANVFLFEICDIENF